MSRNPIFVLEGPDGVGKTTLAQGLCDYLGAKYVHLTYRFKDRMHCYHGAAISSALREAETRPVVVDRWWPSEHVYAKVYRGGTRWPLMRRHLERVATRHGVTFVFCLPEDKERYVKHYEVLKDKRVEMYDQGMGQVYDEFTSMYAELEAQGRSGLLRYDFFERGGQLPEVLQNIVEVSADWRAHLPDYSLDPKFKNLSGDVTRAQFLLVGDRECRFRGREYYPMTQYQPHWTRLSGAMEEIGLNEYEFAYMNFLSAGSVYTAATERALRESSRHLKVVALGNVTAECLMNRGIPLFAKTTHPVDWGGDYKQTLLRSLRA